MSIVVAVTIEVLPLGRAESGYFLAAICLFPELATVLVVGLCSQDLRRAMARCAPLSQRFRTLGDWIIAYLESCARLSIDFTVIFVMNYEIAHVTPIFLRLRRALPLVFPIWHLSATPYRSTTPVSGLSAREARAATSRESAIRQYVMNEVRQTQRELRAERW